MASEIFLFARRVHAYSAANKKRPSERLVAELNAALDPAGKALLALVMANDFDAVEIGALAREHLLAQPWDDAFIDRAELASCLAIDHRDVIRQMVCDTSELTTSLALSYLSSGAEGYRDELQRARAALAALPGLPERQIDARCKTIERRAYALRGGKTREDKVFIGAAHAAAAALSSHKPWAKSNGPKVMAGLARTASLHLDWVVQAVARCPTAVSERWCGARLRQCLEGDEPPVALPPEVSYGPYERT